MIALKDPLKQCPSPETLSDSTKCRLIKALGLLCDVSCYAPWFAETKSFRPCALQVGDLLRGGATSLDCRWLLLTGCIAQIEQNRRVHKQSRACNGESIFGEQKFVVITEAGRAELIRLAAALPAEVFAATHNGQVVYDGNSAQIRYDEPNRELTLLGIHVLALPTNATDLEAVLKRCEQDGWRRKRLPSPFVEVENGKRDQKTRDAVYGLNHCQDPLLIDFHSSKKGAIIWYEVLDEALEQLLDDEAELRRIKRRPR
jgi:hypothetical protein